jgi:putative peptidoglycan lipid II flippase
MNLLKTLASVGGMTIISRILGFIRDSIIARVFGVGISTDAFFVAFKIPNLLRRISAEGAFTQAFVPILAEYKTKKTKIEVNVLISKVATLLGIFLVLITFLGVFGAPWLIYISAPGFISEPEKFNLTVNLLQITFPYIFFISLVSMAGGILNTYGKFAVPAFTPVWLNISFIVAALCFSDFFEQPIKVLAWAVFFGGVLQLFFQIPFLKKIGCIPQINLDLKDKGVWRILKLMGPAVIGVSIIQISLLINTIFASFLSSGSVSWLYYADRLMEFPAGVIGVALSTILLPNLSKSFSKRKTADYSELINWGLRFGILIAVPAATALAILAVPLISTLFYYGVFTKTDIVMTQYALIAYSIGLVGLILIKILAPAFYAQQNVKTPVKIALFTLFCTQFMNLIFIGYLKHAGLALAIGLGACINAGLLFHHLKKGKVFKLNPGWFMFLIKIFFAAFIMALGLFYFKGTIDLWINYSAFSRFTHLITLILFGSMVYFIILKICKLNITDFFKKTIQ